MTSPEALRLEQLTVKYGKFCALDNVSAVFSGGALGLLGPNGAGKSTLLRSILGLVAPHSGNATLLGLNIDKDGKLLRRRIGYMPERDCYIGGMSGVRGLAHLAEICGFRADDAMLRAHDVLHFVGLGEERYREVSDYSVGMRQRYKLAAALVHDPDILFLDEPTNGLDPRGRARMLELIDKIRHEHGLHLIIASHLLPDVERLCNEVWVLDHGRLKHSGNLADLTAAARGASRVKTALSDASKLKRVAESAGMQVSAGANPSEIIISRSEEIIAAKDIFKLAKSCELNIQSIKPAARSLEDAFLEALEAED